ncbi:MAG: hypothetical protein K9N34_06755 [Candidatus Marinimicrobia bacterium]|nr:hypothetical protein [Candidatus Neomarinimicrobiota bacterium]
MLIFAEINTHFDFHGNLGWLILAIMLFSAWIWFTHRRAKEAPTALHGLGVLWVLRGIAALILLLLFFAPEVKVSFSESNEKSVLFLVDNSASMPLAWDSEWDDVWENAAKFVEDLRGNYPVRTTVMSNQTTEGAREFSEIAFDGESSVFPSKFPLQGMEQFSAVVTFTDGQFNVGQSPLDVEWFGKLPIYPLLPAKPKSAEGLQIHELIAPDFISAADSMQFQLTWRHMGSLPAPIEISVADEATQTTLFRKSLTQTLELQTFVSQLRLQKPGVHRLNFQITTTDGKFSTNLIKTVRVGKAQQQVLLVSDVLTPLVTMFQRSLPDSLFSVEILIKSKQGGFILGKDPLSVSAPDLIVLIDRGDLALSDDTKQLINRVYADSIPTIIFNLNTSRLDAAITGIQRIRDPAPDAFTPLLTSQGSKHPLGIMATAIAQTGGETDFWASLPPLESAEQVLWLHGVRIFDKITTPEPLTVVTLAEKRPLLIFNGSGYWRWFFRPPGKAQFNTYWEKVMTYLLNRKNLKLVSLDVQTDVIHVGETAPVFLQVRDVQGTPLDQGSVSLKQVKQQDGSSQSLELRRVSAGLYRSDLHTAEKGDFALVGRVEQQGNLWGLDSLSVHIAPYSAERQVTGVNQLLLERMATKSGGRVIGPDNLPDSELPTGKYTTWHQFGWPGLRSMWLMILLIFVFGLEWAYRRRIGLM